MKKAVLIFLFFLPSFLYGEIHAPETIYSKESGYFTWGIIELGDNGETAEEVMANFQRYGDWLLDGLKKSDPEAEELICNLNDLIYDKEGNYFRINFSFNVWFFRKKGYSLPFYIKDIVRISDNKVRAFKIEADRNHKSSKIIEKLTYIFQIKENNGKKELFYAGLFKLRGFADFIFTLKMYKKNVEWYVYKFAGNFLRELKEIKEEKKKIISCAFP